MVAPTRTTPPTATSSKTSSAVPAYRNDLDGLRGIAITLVACFHVWLGKVSGGVDVFLALSGYFFVGSLLRHAIHSQSARITYWDTINPWPRLKRLLRRLLPALMTVLIGVAVLTVVVLPQLRWNNIGSELIASALYYQNWHLAWNSQDYLAASSANSPLQHIWSMSVQGQFFVITLAAALIFAGILKLAARFLSIFARPAVIKFLVGAAVLLVALASFYWAHRGQELNQPFNYYDTRSRVWEPLAGGLLAIWLPSWRIPNWLRDIATAIALALIISCGFWIVGVEQYPGPWALVPVGSTLLIIWAGATGLQRRAPGADPDAPQPMPLLNRGLASRWPMWLGTIAYSLYLWHWPLLIFYLAWRGQDRVSFVEGVAILAVSLGLAWLTKRYVEDPLRGGDRVRLRKRSSGGLRWVNYTSVVTAVLILATATVGVGIKLWDRHVAGIEVNTATLDPRDYPGARALTVGAPVPALDPVPAPLAVIQDYPETSTDGFMSDFKDGRIHVGVYGDPTATRTIALAGGSHAEMWISALDIVGKRNHFKVKTYLKMGCPLSSDRMPKQLGEAYPQCYDWGQRVVAAIIADRPDAVFTNSTRPRDYEDGDWLPQDYQDIFHQFIDARIPVIGIRDTPWPIRANVDTPICLANGGTAESCGTRRSRSLSPTDPALPFAEANKGYFHALDLSNGICTADFCPAIVGNIIVYKDPHHLSATFVRSLSDELERQLRASIDWIGKPAP